MLLLIFMVAPSTPVHTIYKVPHSHAEILASLEILEPVKKLAIIISHQGYKL